MTGLLVLTLLLSQALPSPVASTCPPTEVKRVKPTKAPDPEWHGQNDWCTGIVCKVVEVVVTVNPDGTVKSAVVQRSWGAGADAAALAAARNSKYIPKTVNCQPVTGTYIFRELFARED